MMYKYIPQELEVPSTAVPVTMAPCANCERLHQENDRLITELADAKNRLATMGWNRRYQTRNDELE